MPKPNLINVLRNRIRDERDLCLMAEAELGQTIDQLIAADDECSRLSARLNAREGHNRELADGAIEELESYLNGRDASVVNRAIRCVDYLTPEMAELEGVIPSLAADGVINIEFRFSSGNAMTITIGQSESMQIVIPR